MHVRILHVNKFLYRKGGAEGYMLDVADLQRNAGHTVALWGMQHAENLEHQQLSHSFPRYSELDPPPSGLKGVGAGARMVWSRSSRRGMQEALRDFRPDVVHCHNIYHQLSPSILAPLRKARIPCVMTLHDYKLACPNYQMLNNGKLCQLCVTGGTWHAFATRCKGRSFAASGALAVESGIHRAVHAYDPVNVFISPSRFLADVMRTTGIAAERLRVINHFVDTAGMAQSTRAGEGFVFGGRLSEEKGIDTLIQALPLLPDDVHLNIAGEGPIRQDLERLAADVAPSRVTFHGRLTGAELRNLLLRSVATVVPSRWYENQPMSILESFAVAVPVVATDLGGIPELVRSGTDGLLVPHNDPAALAAALSRLNRDRTLAHRMGLNARAKIEAQFSPNQHLHALGDAYECAARQATGIRVTSEPAQ